MCITTWYPKLDGSHFDSPYISILEMTALGGKGVWTMLHTYRPLSKQLSGSLINKDSFVPCKML